MTQHVAYIALGSNIEPRLEHIRDAVAELCDASRVSLVARSSLYETAPVGGPPDQGFFLNAVICVETQLSPEELLARCREVEAYGGRVRTVPNGPRTIDLDLLLFDELVRESQELTIPHPRMHERRFVLEPLAEIAAELRHPLLHVTAAQLRQRIEHNGESIRSIFDSTWNNSAIAPL